MLGHCAIASAPVAGCPTIILPPPPFVPGTIDTPAKRRVAVSAEARLAKAPAETRVLSVKKQTRLI